MHAKIIGTLIAITVLGWGFRRLERRWPATMTMPRRRWREAWTDLLHWLITPTLTQLLAMATVVVAAVFTMIVTGGTVRLDRIGAAGGLVRGFGHHPIALQIVETFVIGDLIGYWVHRLFHSQRLWRLHETHHSSTRLDWFAGARNHPLQAPVVALLQAIPLILLGLNGRVVASLAPVLLLHGVLLHANVGWTFGPFRYVLSSPRFHRWHHAADEASRGKNLAGLFPVFDLLFGTYYLPLDRMPESYGTGDSAYPPGWWSQMMRPFRLRA